jgi:hypothetical protein
MGADDEALESDQALLRAVHVVSFTTAPPRIDPFERSTLAWEVTVPATHPPIRITLRGGSVTVASRQGSREVSPPRTTGYSLIASKGRASRLLGTEHVFVDTTGCLTQVIGEDEIRDQVESKVDALIAEHPELSRRRPDRIEIEYDGLHISIRMKAAIDNVADPDIDVDATVSFRAVSGELRWRLDRYSFDVDFPWWQDLVNYQLFPAWLAAALAEGNQESLVRTRLSDAVDDFVQLATAAAESLNLAFLSVATLPNRFEVILCRKPDQSAFRPPSLAVAATRG